MQITYVLELLQLTRIKTAIIERNIFEVARNRTSIAAMLKDGKTTLSTKDFDEKLPSAVINQNIRETKALYKKFKKSKPKKDNIEFKLNQPLCYNNQNFSLNGHFVGFPLYADKCNKYWFPVVGNTTFRKLKRKVDSGAKLGKASLFRKNHKYYLAVTVSIDVKEVGNNNIMGIDIGLNQLAVASIKDAAGNEINRQFHNGKQAGFIRKKYRSTRRSLSKAKKPKAITKIKDKESRYIRDLNHKISRQLVDLAVQEKVSTIVMENLKNIRKTAFSQKKADKNLNSWSFFELQQFTEYKAELASIEVVYISPKYTSQKCSACGEVKKSNRKRNEYSCKCGNKVHADLNAARNIASSIMLELEQSA